MDKDNNEALKPSKKKPDAQSKAEKAIVKNTVEINPDLGESALISFKRFLVQKR